MSALPELAASTLPDIGLRADASRRRSRSGSGTALKQGDHVAVVQALCKTYTATVSKLIYAFAAVKEQMAAEGKASSISEAILTGQRDEMMDNISTALAGGVEKILRANDISLRTGVLRDLRARFVPKEVAKAEVGVQVAPPKTKPTPTPRGGDEAPAAAAVAPPKKEEKAVRPASAAPLAVKAAEGHSADEGAGEGEGADARRPSSAAVPRNSFAERQMAWELRKLERRQEMRQVQDVKERETVTAHPAPAGGARKPSLLYAHVQSAIKMARKEEENGKLAAAERRLEEEVAVRTAVEGRARQLHTEHVALREEAVSLKEERDAAEEELRRARSRARELEAKYDAVKEQAAREAARHADELEVREAFGERGLEQWPMVPGRKVLPVRPADDFDGRISAEFRQKDEEGGTRGVSLLMGRCADSMTTEVQCILFDPKELSDVDAARWWQRHRHRFEKPRPRRGSI